MNRKQLYEFYKIGFVILLIASIYLLFQNYVLSSLTEELQSKNSALEQTLDNEKALSSSLGSELEATKDELDETSAALGQCQTDLEQESSALDVCLTQNDELNEFLNETKDELELLAGQLDAFEAQIKQSMSWFTENSNMDTLPLSLKFQVDHCTSNTEINAACIPIVMKEEKGWAYKIDEGDELLSLEDMSLNKGGDCEDWSLYFKAAYNYLKAEDRPERYLVSVVPGIGEFEIYGEHYYADAEPKEVGTTKDNVYIICYDSHCIVAISDVEIKNSSDVYKLRGAPAVEPQNGQYMFTIGSTFAPDICSPEECDYSDIWIVITDDDIYDFHYNWMWVGYSDYYEAIRYYKSRIDAMNSLMEQTAG